MNIELIAIGDEVLLGFATNSNAAWLAQHLVQEGYSITHHEVVSDDKEQIAQALRSALTRGSCVITTGGLGPTCDDCTKEVAAKLFQRELVEDSALQKDIERRFPGTTTAHNQSIQPQGALLYHNPVGTASGFVLEDKALFGSGCLICLPGVPLEMRRMFCDHVIPFLQLRQPNKKIFVYPIHIAGVNEAQVDPLLRTLQTEEVTIGIYPSYGTLSVHLRVFAASDAEGKAKVAPIEQAIVKAFSGHVYQAPTGKIEEALHRMLIEKNLTFATAESCTGGALAARFVAIPDASRYFRGSIVAYANDVKKSLLHVPEEYLATYGAVSQEVTQKMAEGALSALEADIALATSGIFGPSGGSAHKLVGTVCATIASKRGDTHSWTMHLAQDREVNMQRTILSVLSELYLFLSILPNKS